VLKLIPETVVFLRGLPLSTGNWKAISREYRPETALDD